MTVTINGSGTIGGITAGGLPDAIITQPDLAAGVAGTGPAFSAINTSQSITANVQTKFACSTEQWDTNNCFDSVTNYRFTPNVAGYYNITGRLQVLVSNTPLNMTIWKNGSVLIGIGSTYPQNSDSFISSWQVYCNGSTDYIEMYGSIGITQNCSVGFQASMVRAA